MRESAGRAPVSLALVHQRVGLLQQAVDRCVPRRFVQQLAGAELEFIAALARQVVCIGGVLQAGQGFCASFGRSIGQQHDEFVAAQAAHHIRIAERRCQQTREVAQRVVALRVAVAVVDLLETVQVEEQQRRGLADAPAQAKRLLGQPGEAASIRNLGPLLSG